MTGPDPGPRLPVGLILPWAAVVVAGASVPLWVGNVIPLPDGSRPSVPFEGLMDAALPLLIGAAIAWAALRRPALLGPLGGLRFPPGDVVVLVERALEGVRAVGGLAIPSLPQPWRDAASRLRARGDQGLSELGSRDLLLVRGVSLGLILLGLALLLTLGLLQGL